MKKVIFDVDGVLLSEKRYFDVSALVVWEWYYSPRYMHLKPERITADLDDETIAALRSSSSSTVPFFARRSSAISTMPTAPSTIILRASMMALACWRWSMTAAISGA